MLRFLLIRPGSTDLDDQGRIKGTLDVPMNGNGASQVARTVDELTNVAIDSVYVAPCQSAQQTAQAVAANHGTRVRLLEKLANFNHGLWQGKMIDEVKQTQPRVFRLCQEKPESICPPGGEPLAEARERVERAVEKILKKHKSGVIAVVAPEPLISLFRCVLERSDLKDLWRAELDCGNWELVDIEASKAIGG